MSNNKKTNKLITLILSIVAIFISIFSLFISYQSKNIAENSFLLNIDPMLLVKFDINNSHTQISLKIKNDGTIPINEIRIISLSRIYNDSLKSFPISTSSTKAWNYLDKLEPGEFKEFKIEYSELENTYTMSTISNAITLPIQLYSISYRRITDRKKYFINKYIFLQKTSDKQPLLIFDLDGHFFDFQHKIKKKIEDFDKTRLK